ncbi:MAG: uracil phosphoribosyltransferase [Caulobacteraceae bacterium]
MNGVNIVDHPLVLHKLAILRDKTTSTKNFRQVSREIATLLCYEVTRDLEMETARVETPMGELEAPKIMGKKLVFAPILRSGLAMVEGMLDLVPSARVAHIGLYRDPATLGTVEYYFKAPEDTAERLVIVVDALIGTGNTAVAAVDRLKELGVKRIRFVSLVASPSGAAMLRGAHPDVALWCAAVDEGLSADGFIVPGVGDAGDRMYGTR